MTWLFSLVLILAAVTQAEARCYDVGTSQFRCDPIVSQALRRRVEAGAARRYTLPRARRYELDVQSYQAGEAIRQTWRYKDSTGRRFKGSVLSLPGGQTLHKGTVRR